MVLLVNRTVVDVDQHMMYTFEINLVPCHVLLCVYFTKIISRHSFYVLNVCSHITQNLVSTRIST